MTNEVATNETSEKKELFDKPFYRIKEVSNLLSMGVSTIYLYQKMSQFPKPIVMSSRLSLYSGESLNHWCEEVMPKLEFVSKQPEADMTKFYN